MALVQKAAPYDLDLARDMAVAQKKYGAGFGKQIADFLALRVSGAGLSFDEYIYFGLYGRDRKDYPAYIGNHRARAAFFIANKISSWNEAEDKISFHAHVAGAALPTPRLLAIAHETREAAGVQTLRNIDDVEAFLSACAIPVFGKPVIASHGDGAVNIAGRDGDRVIMDDGSTAPIAEVASDIEPFVSGKGFLFQDVLTPHTDISEMTGGRLATVRLMVWLGPDGADVRHAVLRLPAGENRVDNFRRAGNLIAPVDLATGALGAAHRGVGVNTETVETHPDTGALITGVCLPDFAEAKALVQKAAPLYRELRIQSWDVALTDQGPSLLEVNPGGNFNIIQLASGRGAFDQDFRKFLEYCVEANPSARENAKAFKEATKLLKLK